MHIVGLTGAIGSGKTTFGNFLGAAAKRHLHLESSSLVIEVANELHLHNPAPFPKTDNLEELNEWLSVLPPILERQLHRLVDWDTIKIVESDTLKNPENYQKLLEYIALLNAKPALQNESISVDNKAQHRPILQWLGGYLAKRVSGDIWYCELIRRGGIDQDIDLLTLGGVRFPADTAVIREQGGLIIGLVRPSLEAQDATDVTERERSLITPDTLIHNDGSVEQLQQLAEQVYAEISANDYRREYFASSI